MLESPFWLVPLMVSLSNQRTGTVERYRKKNSRPSSRPPWRPRVMTTTESNIAQLLLKNEIEEFLFQEAELLDERCF